MNYRIDMRRDAVIADINSGNYSRLLAQDQLLKEMKNNRAFRLRSFVEGPLTFAPTYKYDRRSDEYDTSEKVTCTDGRRTGELEGGRHACLICSMLGVVELLPICGCLPARRIDNG